MTLPLSMVIIAKNERLRIEDCIKSAYGWADEIIIMDDESTDNTRELASKYTNKIFIRKMELEGKQRNFGAAQAKHNWVMMLDCDERLTDELKKEIEGVVTNTESKVVAAWVPKNNYLGHVQLEHGGWSNPHIRLYDRRYARWSESPQDVVHPGFKIDSGYQGTTLKNRMIHYNFANVEDMMAKINRYSTLEAIKWYRDGRKMPFGKAMWRFVDRFFRRYIGKKGYKDGFYGYVAAVISSVSELASYAKYREIKETGAYIDRYKEQGTS